MLEIGVRICYNVYQIGIVLSHSAFCEFFRLDNLAYRWCKGEHCQSKRRNVTMKKMMIPIIAFAMVMCTGTAQAVIGRLSLARTNLYNSRMRAYNSSINYHQKASLFYTNKMFGLTNMKYGYGSYKKTSYGSFYKRGTSVVLPTISTTRKAANASSTSELMSILKGWGSY